MGLPLSCKKAAQRTFEIATLLLTLRSPLALSFLWGVAIAGIKYSTQLPAIAHTPRESKTRIPGRLKRCASISESFSGSLCSQREQFTPVAKTGTKKTNDNYLKFSGLGRSAGHGTRIESTAGSNNIAVQRQFLCCLLCKIGKLTQLSHPFQNVSSSVSSAKITGR